MLLSVGLPRDSFFFIRLTNAPENPRNGNGVGEGHQGMLAAAMNDQVSFGVILRPLARMNDM